MSKLDFWLRVQGMSAVELAKSLKCSETTIWKIKRDMTVSREISEKIEALTKGFVKPRWAEVGRRPKHLANNSTTSFSEY